MGLFNFFKSRPSTPDVLPGPYRENSTNLIYNLLFCDDLELYKAHTKPPFTFPFDVLFAETTSLPDLQRIVDDHSSDPRIKVLAYNRMLAAGHKSERKELLAVIVEVGLDDGLDVLASFNNGTARYINQTGKILIWETTDATSNALTKDLFDKSRKIVEQIGPWDQLRRPRPVPGNARITFLVSDGLYFGEGPMDVLFNDPLAAPALMTATELMRYFTEKALEKKS